MTLPRSLSSYEPVSAIVVMTVPTTTLFRWAFLHLTRALTPAPARPPAEWRILPLLCVSTLHPPLPPTLPPSHSHAATTTKNNNKKPTNKLSMPPVRLKLTYEGRTFRRTVDAVTFNWTEFLTW